jgi:hypothetical protein
VQNFDIGFHSTRAQPDLEVRGAVPQNKDFIFDNSPRMTYRSDADRSRSLLLHLVDVYSMPEL